MSHQPSPYFAAAIKRLHDTAPCPSAMASVFESVVADIEICLALQVAPPSLHRALQAAICRADIVGVERGLAQISQVWAVASGVDGIAEDPAQQILDARAAVRRERSLRVKGAVFREAGNLERAPNWIGLEVDYEVKRLHCAEERDLLRREEASERFRIRRRRWEEEAAAERRRSERARAKARRGELRQCVVAEMRRGDAHAVKEASRLRLLAWVTPICEWVYASGSTLQRFSKEVAGGGNRLSRWRMGKGWPSAEVQRSIYEVTGVAPLGERG